MLDYNTSIIKSEKNIKYFYLCDLMFKIIFIVSEMINSYFDDNTSLFLIENPIHKNKILILLTYK
jgi:hypothetical protein